MSDPREMTNGEVTVRLLGAALVGIIAAVALVLTRGAIEPLALFGSVGSATLVIAFVARQPVAVPYFSLLWGVGVITTVVIAPAVPSDELFVPHLIALWSLHAVLCGLAAALLRFRNRSAR